MKYTKLGLRENVTAKYDKNIHEKKISSVIGVKQLNYPRTVHLRMLQCVHVLPINTSVCNKLPYPKMILLAVLTIALLPFKFCTFTQKRIHCAESL